MGRTLLAACAIACLGVAAGCAGGGAPPRTTGAATGVETEAAAPRAAETGAELAAVAEGSCADSLEPGSPPDVLCGWFARFEEASCERMSDGLLVERFGAGGEDGLEACRATLAPLEPVEDAGAIAFASASVDGDAATLDVVDASSGRERAYVVSFVRSDGRWLLDAVARDETAADTGSRAPPPPQTREARREIVALVRSWYAELDPSVCDRMTGAMLELGWEDAGDRGRSSCKEGIAAAEPLEDVRVRRPTVDGDRARARVVYRSGDVRQFDTVLLVREDGGWLIDGLGATGFLP